MMNRTTVLCLGVLAILVPSLHAEEVFHRSGSHWSWPGRDLTGDYLRSPNRALLESRPNWSDRGVFGGYASTIDLLESLGSSAFQEPEDRVSDLLSRHSQQIRGGAEFRSLLTDVASDSGMFIVLERFLEAGGSYEEIAAGGRYTPAPLKIIAALKNESGVSTGKTLFHELLHSYFDRTDSVLWELKTGGGADHLAISALEDRYLITNAFLKSKTPLNRQIGGLYGFTRDGFEGDRIAPLLRSTSRVNIRAAVNRTESESFYGTWVQSGMVSVLSSREVAARARDTADANLLEAWTENRTVDLAFLHAWNAQVYAMGIRIAAEEALRSRRSIEAVILSGDTRAKFHKFLRAFVDLLRVDPTIGPQAAAKRADREG